MSLTSWLVYSVIVSGMSAANFSVYVFTGAELHWRQAKNFTGDAAAVRTLLTGLTGFLIGEALLISGTFFTARYIHTFTGGVLHVLAWPCRWVVARLNPCLEPFMGRIRSQLQTDKPLPDPRRYEQISLEDDYLNDSGEEDEGDYFLDNNTRNHITAASTIETVRRVSDRLLPRLLVILFMISAVVLRCIRPADPVYLYLSGTLPLSMYFEGGGHTDTAIDISALPWEYNYLKGNSSLSTPPDWSWMTKEAGPGFDDWKKGKKITKETGTHYNPDNPLHLSNLQDPVLDQVKDALESGDVKIKHVILLKLESARADIFPLRKDSFMHKRIASTWPDKQIPKDVTQIIANLTPTAERLTGFPNGYEYNNSQQEHPKPYGGISAKNAYTTSTYTLKSLAGTLCGITPLVADFNREWEYHIYNPCMPHVLDMLNKQQEPKHDTRDFTYYPWHSVWMQSVTEGYDNQDKLTPQMGFFDKRTKEIMEEANATHPITSEEINYYGYADTELREYIRDVIDDAERNHTRLFLTHLTGTTHHPWGLPNDIYADILGNKKGSNNDLNRYLNAVGFVDDWLAEILDILEEKGIRNETLIAMAGDHGLSLPNDGGITPYDNPHVGSFQVPIVLAHPHLPPVTIEAPTSSDQIVPSIIDLLIESRSLSKHSTRAAKDILSMYEGQSLIRPLIQEKNGVKDWQFTVMNTGGSWLAVRSAARPEFRLVIPLVSDVEWRFSDLSVDPDELEPISRFSLGDLATDLSKKYEKDVLDWLYEAAYVSNWWVEENWARWRFTPPNKKEKKVD